ncbi:hypothetical protein MCELHM10_03063 [Paracoccaceae bacterium]
MRPLRRFLGALLILVAAPVHAQSQPECSCTDLEGLQQDYQNTVYLEKSYRDLAKSMKDWEANAFKTANIQTPPMNVPATSRAMVDRAAKEYFFVPFPQVDGYFGPMSVEMTPKTCDIDPALVTKMEEGAPCSGAAEAEVLNAVRQQLVCEKMGAKAYWDRPGSAFALEKAENYKTKAADLKTQIGLALDKAEITVSGDWLYTMSMPGMEMTYHFQFESKDINRSSSTGETWDFSATGETRHELTGTNFDGLSCTGSGAVVHQFNVKLKTDGLTFGLVFDGKLGGGEHVVTCAGTAVPMPGAEGSGWGQFNTPTMPLDTGETALPSGWTEALAPMSGVLGMMAGIDVTGEPKTSLNVSCPMP